MGKKRANLVLKAAWLHQLFIYGCLDEERERPGWWRVESASDRGLVLLERRKSSGRSRTSQPLIEGVNAREGIQEVRLGRVLKMDRRKRKGSGGRATNANQKYPTVEAGEMVTVEQGGTSVVDLDEDGEQLDYLEVASLLGEKLKDFVKGGKGEPPGLELRSLLHLAASRKIVSVDSEKMSPALWGTLPRELLLLVLVRLPLPDIARLRGLSKEWNRDMATVYSEINQALEETSPTMVAVVSFTDYFTNSTFLVTICDLSTLRPQYSYRLHPGGSIRHENRWDAMGARDGGLVCFVSTWEPSKANPLCIVVWNLLTQVRRKLPPLQYVYSTPPKMMHIEVDSATKCYRVVVVGKNRKGCPTVEIYHSGSRQWTKATPPLGVIFGVTYSRWKYHGRSFRCTSLTQNVYDFAERQLKRCEERGPSRGASVMAHARQKDYMFVLHRNTSNGEILPTEGHCITKYRMLSNAKDWVQERSYLCSPLEALLEKDCHWTLKACEGFVTVFQSFSDTYFWLLDLSSAEWSSLPNCFMGHKFGTFMTRASWNVVP